METWDVVIVGAGIVGCACARECAREGFRVAIIEAGVTAGGASAAGMGHVVVMDDSPAQLALTSYARALWNEERAGLPASVEYLNRGTLWIAADEQEMAEVYAKRKTFDEAGIGCEVLDAAALAGQEPNLRRGLAGGLLVPGDAVMYPPAAAAFYLAEAQRLGARLYRGRALSAGHGEVLLADGTRLPGERIVLAVGVECDLLPALPIKKRKGHLVITDRYPGFVQHQLVELGYLKSAHKVAEDSVAFNIQPRQTGQLLIGSSRQFGDEDPGAEATILNRMLERATSYMPALAQLSGLRVWTGFRAATADKLPLLGPAAGVADDASLWLAMGFEGLGITHAPGAARLLVEQMLGRETAIDARPLLPARLSLKVGAACG